MNFEQARFNMIEQQVRPCEVLDRRVLQVMAANPREDYVPEAQRALAFADLELPLPHGQQMLAPKMEGRILQAVHPRAHDRVLEIGTGSGYLTALLARRAAEVVSVEINPEIARLGRANLERHGAENVRLEIGDAARGTPPGLPSRAPYDVIVLTGSVPLLPRAFQESLAAGGRLFAVVGEPPVMSAQLVSCVAPGSLQAVALFETVLAPLANCERPSRFRF